MRLRLRELLKGDSLEGGRNYVELERLHTFVDTKLLPSSKTTAPFGGQNQSFVEDARLGYCHQASERVTYFKFHLEKQNIYIYILRYNSKKVS